MTKALSRIRNFAIIAHIDHGKSTLADRLIQHCDGLSDREMREQVLDSMDIERERGITIKAQTVRLKYTDHSGRSWQLNLLDTPGHVDFGYEVSRSLSACEGVLLIIDASQGVEAQTLANTYIAVDNSLEIILVLNKIDLPAAEPDRVREEIENVIGIDASTAIETSAKTGAGVTELLEAIVTRLPAPSTPSTDQLCALLIDSWYDSYMGVVMLVRVYSGTIKKNMKIRFLADGTDYRVEQIGIFTPKATAMDSLSAGEIGYVVAGIKTVSNCRIGDTLTQAQNPITTPLPGFKPSVPVVFCGLFLQDSNNFPTLREALKKLALNDSSFSFEGETSPALGFGMRCGFLGLLHLEIIRERLEREFDLDLITTAPSVIYKIHLRNGALMDLHNPSNFPDPAVIESIDEPWTKATIMVPEAYVGPVLTLCAEVRGVQESLEFQASRAIVRYLLPLNEVVFNFHDRLKSISRGYASFDYEMFDYRRGELVKIAILINSDPVDALSMIVHRNEAEGRGRAICEKLKDLIPRQMFKVPIQATIGGKVIARETVAAMRKDVTAKCYGGDVTRKRKLLDKQKKGKERMRQFGKVEIPGKVFIEALKID
ncbi:MAG: elongation factor 4 [Alphaproteobacteria bacterium]|nr:elongation factor 4 [Alphaproteobacteria bacterium]